MTTGNARTSPSLALARRIAAVGLLAGGPALTGERTSRHHRAGERGQRREGGDRRRRSRHQPAVNASRRPPVTAITAKTIRRTLLTRLVLAGVVWLGGLHGAQAGVDVWTTTGPEGGTIRALAIDPQNPATLYAAVSRNASPDSSDVYKSTDAGSNWRAVAIGLSGSPQALAIDPQTPTTLYLRAYRRVYKSTDGGGRWTLVNTSLPGSYLSTQNLVIDPQTPTTLYAGTFGEGVFKSTDGGGSWNAVNTGLPTYPPGYYYPHSHVAALAIAPETPTTFYQDMAGVPNSTNGAARAIPARL